MSGRWTAARRGAAVVRHQSAGLAMGGCVLLSIGLGMLFGNVGAGTLIGVGCGLLAMAWLVRA